MSNSWSAWAPAATRSSTTSAQNTTLLIPTNLLKGLREIGTLASRERKAIPELGTEP